ncbi:hypothetical protein T484DRAFT_1806189, partial [Baffinella frigidus]
MPRRRVALAVAGASALAAVALVALVVQRAGPSELQQRVPTYYMPKARLDRRATKQVPEIVEMKNPQTGEPVYYMPVKNAMKAPQPKLAAAKPVVYYYMPKASMLAGNDTAGNDTAADAGEEEFVCTTANIIALSAEVQPEWDACMENPGYEVPNKDAKRRLMNWVWEPEDGAQKSAAPRQGPSHYEMKMTAARKSHNLAAGAHRMSAKLAASHLVISSSATMLPENATDGAADANATDAAPEGPSMDECKEKATAKACAKIALCGNSEKATAKACAKIASCGNPVCTSYYKEPEIEALCGMCVMSGGAGFFGCFADEGVVEVAGKGEVSVASLQ